MHNWFWKMEKRVYGLVVWESRHKAYGDPKGYEAKHRMLQGVDEVLEAGTSCIREVGGL